MTNDFSSSPAKCGRRVVARRGHSLVEILVSSVISLLVFGGVITLLLSATNFVDRQHVEAQAGNRARTSLDEIASVIRYADAVLPSSTINGVNYVTGTNTVVLRAPGYDPATPGLVLPGITDTIVFKFDAQKGEIQEICSPGIGSVRPSRASYRLADDVQSVAFSYRVRQLLPWNATNTYVLGTIPSLTPTVSVNGVVSQKTWASTSPKALIVTASSGADIQATYPINPITEPGKSLPLVKDVSVAVVFNAIDSKKKNRVQSMSCTARLRNQRN